MMWCKAPTNRCSVAPFRSTARRHPRDQGFVRCVERLHATWLMDTGLFDERFPTPDGRARLFTFTIETVGKVRAELDPNG